MTNTTNETLTTDTDTADLIDCPTCEGSVYPHAEALTAARILDFGVAAEEVSPLLNARIRARARNQSKALPEVAA